MKLRVSDLTQGSRVQSRVRVTQQKTQQPVQFEITPQTRQSLEDWMMGSHSDPKLLPVFVHRSL